MNVLVCGGAGYIGSHCVRILGGEGYHPVVYDNLVYGHRESVSKFRFYHGDILEKDKLVRVLKECKIDLVMHYAAYAYVGESVQNPRKYYNNNVTAALALLDSMLDAGTRNIIFSSSCSTFGIPEQAELDETHPQKPINPYGMSKFIVERVLQDYQKAYGLQHVIIRYFNAAGADPSGTIGEDHNPETHLIPLVLQTALGQRDHIQIFGTDYRTVDGTCVRDYIHVCDLADVHILAMKYLMGGGESTSFNVGNGNGYSVKEVIEVARKVTGKPIRAIEGPRRDGDPDRLVASCEKASKILGWVPKYHRLEDIITTAWKWHASHPSGYSRASISM